jgi:hypothetical protein
MNQPRTIGKIDLDGVFLTISHIVNTAIAVITGVHT